VVGEIVVMVEAIMAERIATMAATQDNSEAIEAGLPDPPSTADK
jgi:hypothetical protein